MRIQKRGDGTILLSIGGGVGVLMRGALASPPRDLSVLDRLGPWQETDNSLAARRQAQKDLSKCRTAAVENFSLGKK